MISATLRRPGDWWEKPGVIESGVAEKLALNASLSEGCIIRVLPSGVATLSARYDFVGCFEVEFRSLEDAVKFTRVGRTGNTTADYLEALGASV